jgi:hypothetical protein
MSSTRRSRTPSPFVEIEDEEMIEIQGTTPSLPYRPPSQKMNSLSSPQAAEKVKLIFEETTPAHMEPNQEAYQIREEELTHELQFAKTKKFLQMALDGVGTIEPEKLDSIMAVASSFDLVEQLVEHSSQLWKYSRLATISLTTHLDNIARSRYEKRRDQLTPNELLTIFVAWCVSRKLFVHLTSTDVVKNVIELLSSSQDQDQIERHQESEYLASTQNKSPFQTIPEAISTSSMTVTKTVVPADATGLKKQDPFDLLRATCGHTNGQQMPSTRNSYISARKGSSSHVCSLQTDVCPYQLSMRCCCSEDISNVPINQRCLLSYMNITYHFEEDSVAHGLLKQLMVAVTQEALARGGHHFETRN